MGHPRLTAFGGTVVLLVEDNLDPVVLLDLAERERVAQLVVVGDAFAVPLAEALDAQPERWKLDSLVRLAPGASLSVEQLTRFCGSCLARFKLPRHVKVVRELPRTPTGKPDYRGGAAQLQRQANG